MRPPRNPYVAGRAVTGEAFFGRDDVFQLVQDVLNSQDNAVVLYGQRRIGKTSILLQLEHLLPSWGYTPVYFDLMHKAEKPLRDVLIELAERIASRIGLDEDIDEDVFDEHGHYFREQFLDLCAGTLQGEQRLVILFDEFDVLDAARQDDLAQTVAARTFFPYLAELMQRAATIMQFVFVVGRKAEELSTDALAIFKTARYQRISVLDREATADLVTGKAGQTLHFSPKALSGIYMLANGHPFLTQLICQKLFDRAYRDGAEDGPPTVGVDDVRAVVPDVLDQGTPQFEWIWDGLPPAEKVIMAAVAQTGTVSKEDLVNVLQSHGIRILVRQLELAPDTLVEWELLRRADENSYAFFIELLRLWVQRRKPLPSVKEELDRIDPLANQLFSTGQSFLNYAMGATDPAVREQQLNAAITQFQQALAVNRNHFNARLLLGEALQLSDQHEEALQYLREAFQQDPEAARYRLLEALLQYAEALEDASEIEAAAVLYDEIIVEVAPNNPVANERSRALWYQRGELLAAEQQFGAALDAYRRADAEDKVGEIVGTQVGALVTKRQFDAAVELTQRQMSEAHLGIAQEAWLEGAAQLFEAAHYGHVKTACTHITTLFDDLEVRVAANALFARAALALLRGQFASAQEPQLWAAVLKTMAELGLIDETDAVLSAPPPEKPPPPRTTLTPTEILAPLEELWERTTLRTRGAIALRPIHPYRVAMRLDPEKFKSVLAIAFKQADAADTNTQSAVAARVIEIVEHILEAAKQRISIGQAERILQLLNALPLKSSYGQNTPGNPVKLPYGKRAQATIPSEMYLDSPFGWIHRVFFVWGPLLIVWLGYIGGNYHDESPLGDLFFTTLDWLHIAIIVLLLIGMRFSLLRAIAVDYNEFVSLRPGFGLRGILLGIVFLVAALGILLGLPTNMNVAVLLVATTYLATAAGIGFTAFVDQRDDPNSYGGVAGLLAIPIGPVTLVLAAIGLAFYHPNRGVVSIGDILWCIGIAVLLLVVCGLAAFGASIASDNRVRRVTGSHPNFKLRSKSNQPWVEWLAYAAVFILNAILIVLFVFGQWENLV